MARISEWSPYTKYVQAGLVDGQFLNASFTLLAAGPPRLSQRIVHLAGRRATKTCQYRGGYGGRHCN
jgi:hypothetical protein